MHTCTHLIAVILLTCGLSGWREKKRYNCTTSQRMHNGEVWRMKKINKKTKTYWKCELKARIVDNVIRAARLLQLNWLRLRYVIYIFIIKCGTYLQIDRSLNTRPCLSTRAPFVCRIAFECWHWQKSITVNKHSYFSSKLCEQSIYAHDSPFGHPIEQAVFVEIEW